MLRQSAPPQRALRQLRPAYTDCLPPDPLRAVRPRDKAFRQYFPHPPISHMPRQTRHIREIHIRHNWLAATRPPLERYADPRPRQTYVKPEKGLAQRQIRSSQVRQLQLELSSFFVIWFYYFQLFDSHRPTRHQNGNSVTIARGDNKVRHSTMTLQARQRGQQARHFRQGHVRRTMRQAEEKGAGHKQASPPYDFAAP